MVNLWGCALLLFKPSSGCSCPLTFVANGLAINWEAEVMYPVPGGHLPYV